MCNSSAAQQFDLVSSASHQRFPPYNAEDWVTDTPFIMSLRIRFKVSSPLRGTTSGAGRCCQICPAACWCAWPEGSLTAHSCLQASVAQQWLLEHRVQLIRCASPAAWPSSAYVDSKVATACVTVWTNLLLLLQFYHQILGGLLMLGMKLHTVGAAQAC